MRFLLVLLTLGFLAGLGEANIRESHETGEMPTSILVAEQYCQDTLSISNAFPNLDVARRGCCSHHKGVCGCKGATLTVKFYPKPDVKYPGEVKEMDGGNPKGLAVVLVHGSLPKGIRPLPLGSNVTIKGGEPITLVGFPRLIGLPWAIASGIIAGQKGLDLIITGSAVQEGNSGGPILLNGSVVGVLTEIQKDFGYGVPSSITQIALKGWGVHVEQSSNQVGQVFPSDPWDKMLMTVPLPKEISGKDGAPMVLVPAGEFTMGSPDGVGEKEEHPQHTVDLDAFYIDQYEVTTEQYAQFMSATGHSAPEFWDQVDSSRDGKKPVIGINWDDAQTYCDWAGKRLPTEAEWEKAARGTDQRTYPWGDTNLDSRIANFGKDWDSEVYAERLKAVGSYERGKSPYGAYDMVGNVSEWGADWYDKDYYGKSPQKNPHGPSSGVLKVLRGGSWLDSPTYLRSALRYWFNPAYRYANIGVRCAQDAP